MPDVHSRNKRPPVSGFGEGTVVKRPRGGSPENREVLHGRPPIAKAISSGPDNGFRVKSAFTSTVVQKQSRSIGLPLNQDDALAPFKKTMLPASRALALAKSGVSVRAQPRHLAENNPFAEPGKTGPVPVTPLSTRIRPLDLHLHTSTPNKKTRGPSRKALPFSLLRVPISRPDEFLEESSATPPMRPLVPKFDLGDKGKGKGKMVAMTEIEPPNVELPEEKEVNGEILELRRGLLVSPEKRDRRRGKFIRSRLADRAQSLINRSSTALTLWKKEMGSSSSLPKRPPADLLLRVKSVVHILRNENTHSRSAGALRFVLAICSCPDGEERNVLFSFMPDLHDLCDTDDHESFIGSAEVLVWKPWQETRHPPTLFCSRFVVLSGSS